MRSNPEHGLKIETTAYIELVTITHTLISFHEIQLSSDDDLFAIPES